MKFVFIISIWQDHDYCCPGSDTLRLRWFGAQDQIQRLKQQLDKVRMRECRAKRLIKNLLGELKQKNVLIKELQMKLNEHSGKLSYTLTHTTVFKCYLFRRIS